MDERLESQVTTERDILESKTSKSLESSDSGVPDLGDTGD